MNVWLLAGGIVAAVTAGVHVFAGHFDPVLPLLNRSWLSETTKRTLHGVWHMVTADLLLAAGALCYWAVAQPDGYRVGVAVVVVHFVCYAAIFVVITTSRRWPRRLLRLPQWILLLPVALLSLVGIV